MNSLKGISSFFVKKAQLLYTDVKEFLGKHLKLFEVKEFHEKHLKLFEVKEFHEKHLKPFS